MLSNFLARLASHPKHLFLLDGMGGFASAVAPLIIVWKFETLIGLPRELLIAMALTGFLYGSYSLLCALKIKTKWALFLKILVGANATYLFCLMAYTVLHFSSLSPLGLAYLLIDHLVLISVIFIELNVLAALSGLWIPGTKS
jgi:hypothetical protein